MRLSSPLLANVNRNILRFKQLWEVKGKRRIIETPTPKLLIEKGVHIIDAKTLVEPPAKQFDVMEFPEHSRPPPSLKSPNHPKWKPTVCHTYFVNNMKIAEGLSQAQVLTKTVVHEGLPKRIQDLVGVADQDDQDELVQRCILNSQIYDAWQTKLPKKIDIKRPGHVFARPYGTPVIRKLQILLRHLLRLAESQTGTYQGILQRSVLHRTNCVITTERNESLLQFGIEVDILVTAKEPLQLFANKDEVAKVYSAELPNIYPVKCTIDLFKTNVYDDCDFYPFNKTFSNPRVHTLYLAHKFADHSWRKTQKLAKAVMACYTLATAQARWLYGDVKDLPEPVAVQCVLSNGPLFTLVAYQLNTLSLNDSDATRNMAWIAPDMKLFEVCYEEPGKIHFEGYNPEVYKWLLAMYLNGLSSSPPLSTSYLKPSTNLAASVSQPNLV